MEYGGNPRINSIFHTNTMTDIKPTQTTETVTQTPSKEMVTSTKDVDFPTLNWGISAGETRELPQDAEARTAILAVQFITKKK